MGVAAATVACLLAIVFEEVRVAVACARVDAGWAATHAALARSARELPLVRVLGPAAAAGAAAYVLARRRSTS